MPGIRDRWQSDRMTDAAETAETPEAAPDPKAAMKAALERKKAQQNHGDGLSGSSKVSGGPHRQASGHREFRRKAGG